MIRLVALLCLALGCARPPTTAPPGERACQEDAKVCPDGSSVGRTGPDCEFAACPGPAPEPPDQPPGAEPPAGGLGGPPGR
jgi:hypothetical protein